MKIMRKRKQPENSIQSKKKRQEAENFAEFSMIVRARLLASIVSQIENDYPGVTTANEESHFYSNANTSSTYHSEQCLQEKNNVQEKLENSESKLRDSATSQVDTMYQSESNCSTDENEFLITAIEKQIFGESSDKCDDRNFIELLQLQMRKKEDAQRKLLDFINSDSFLQVIDVAVQITPGELFLLLLKFSLKNHLSLEGIEGLCKLVNCIFAIPVVPDTCHLIDAICNRESKVYYFKNCPQCFYILSETSEPFIECHNCKEKVPVPKNYSSNTFVLIDPSDAIAELIQKYEAHYDYVVKERPYFDGIYTDIYDGVKYRKFLKSLPVNDKYQYVTLTLNSDGAQPFESTNDSVWPLYISINELPLSKRFKHIITCGIYFGKTQPKMRIYLHEFVKMILNIRSKGISCIVKNEKRSLKPYVINSVDDTPARKKMSGKISFHGYFGCDWCYIKGFYYAKAMRYVIDGPIILRKKSETRKYMLKAVQRGLSIKGIKTITPLLLLDEFDIDEGFSPDAMHCAISGAGKEGTRKLLKRLTPDQRVLMDNFLLQIRAPTSINRLTRPMKERSEWKAREWENYILFYSIPILELIGTDEMLLGHWSLFVNSLHILFKDKIVKSELEKADEMLREYVVKMQLIYGKASMNYNCHQLLHIPRTVLNFGPLHLQTTYPYESENGRLVSAIKSANGVHNQVIRYINLTRTIEFLKDIVYPHAFMHTKEYLDSDEKHKSTDFIKVADGVYFYGEYKIIEHRISNFNYSAICKFYKNMFFDGCNYGSSLKVNARSCNSYAKLKSGEYIKIFYFANDETNEKNYCICKIVDTVPHHLSDFIHICIKESIELKAVDITLIDKQCVFMEISNLQFISARPNSLSY